MSLKIIFADKAEVKYLDAIETEEYYNGSSRRVITFYIARDAISLDKLDALCTETNCAKLELSNDDAGITNIYEGYVLKLKVGSESVLTDAEKQTYEDRIVLKLGKRTYIEEKLHELGIN